MTPPSSGTPAAAAASGILDLSPGKAAPAATGRRPLPPRREARRLVGGEVTRLTTKAPTVTLNRVQSAVGVLHLSLVRSATAGDLSLGCVYEQAGGVESVVQALGGQTTGPVGATRPWIWIESSADGHETVAFDLRHVGSLRRAMLYGFSPVGAPINWDGVLVATTYGGARIEAPFDRAPSSATLALLTIYNVSGELVLRSEMDEVYGPPEAAAIAFDHHLPWLDGRYPPR